MDNDNCDIEVIHIYSTTANPYLGCKITCVKHETIEDKESECVQDDIL